MGIYIANADVVLDEEVQYLTIPNNDFSNGTTSWGNATQTNPNAYSRAAEIGGLTCLELYDNDPSVGSAPYSALITIPEGMSDEEFVLRFKSRYQTGAAKSSIGFRVYNESVQVNSGTTGLTYGASTNAWTENEIEFVPNSFRTAANSHLQVTGLRIYMYSSTTVVGIHAYFTGFSIESKKSYEKILKTPVFKKGEDILNDFSASLAGETLDVTASIIDRTAISKKVTLLSAVYSGSNEMLSFSMADNSGNLNGDYDITDILEVPTSLSQGSYAAAMVWDDITTMNAYDSVKHIGLPPAFDTALAEGGTKITVAGSLITVSGSRTAANVPIIMMKYGKTEADLSDPEASVLHLYQAKSENGKFSHTFSIPIDAQGGSYVFLVGGAEAPEIITKMVPTASTMKDFLNNINAGSVSDAFSSYAALLELPYSTITALESVLTPDGKPFIYDYFGKLPDFNTDDIALGMSDFNSHLEKAMALAYINGEENIEALNTLLKGYKQLLNLNFGNFGEIEAADSRKITVLNILKNTYLPSAEVLNEKLLEAYLLTFANNPKSWSELSDIISDTANFTGIDLSQNSTYGALSDKPKLFKALIEIKPFTSAADLKLKFNNAAAAQLSAQQNSGGSVVTRPPSGGGGAGGGGGVTIIPPKKTADSVLSASISLFVNKSTAYVNGKEKLLDIENSNITARIMEGRTMVPVRFLSENFGAEVLWDGEENKVTINYGGRVTVIKIGEMFITVNDEKYEIDVPATIIDGRTLLPLRAFCERALGKTVFWDDRGLILISTGQTLQEKTDEAIISDIINKFN